jgi:hypothetical protein
MHGCISEPKKCLNEEHHLIIAAMGFTKAGLPNTSFVRTSIDSSVLRRSIVFEVWNFKCSMLNVRRPFRGHLLNNHYTIIQMHIIGGGVKPGVIPSNREIQGVRLITRGNFRDSMGRFYIGKAQ